MIEPKLRFKADDGSQFPNWERKKIVNVSDRVKVGFVGTCECYYTDESGIRLYRTGNLQKGRLVEDDMKYVLKKFHEANKKSQLHKWDILIARHGNSGNAVLYDSDEEANCLNIVIIRPDLKVINPKFMVENINSASVEKQVCRLKNGSTQVVLNTKAIEDLDVGIPCLPEQHKIAEFLSTIDTVIEKQKETVSAWEERKKGVMQKLFSQKIRFKADDGSEFPEWEEKKLDDVAVRVTRKNKDNITDIPLTISSADGLIDQRDFFNKVVASKDMSGYYLLKKGEFAYNKSYSKGYDFGSIKKLDLYAEGALSTLYICFALNKDENPDFYQKYFDSLFWYLELQKICAEGARNHGLLNVSTNEFFQMKLKVPSSKQEQKKIADCLSSLDEVIEKQKATVAAWEELKKGLLQQMFV